MKNYSRITGILMLVVGVILLIWPGSTLISFCRLLGWCLVIGGALEVILGITGAKSVPNTAGGVIAAVVGVVFIARPGLIITFLPFVVGLAVAAVGAAYLVQALLRREQGPRAVMAIAGGVVALIVGVFLMINPFSAVKLLMIVLGILLIYFGILRIGLS